MGDGQKRTLTIDETPRADPHLLYSLYGLRIGSEIPLPVASALPGALAALDVVIRRSNSPAPPIPEGPAVASIPCPIHGSDMLEHRDREGTSIWLHSIGTFHVSSDATLIDVYQDREVDDVSLGVVLGGPILLFVKHQLGSPSLHASAVVLGTGAVGFLGSRGQGKSTMVSTFLRRGAELLSDDAIALQARTDRIYGEPGPAFMKMWSETAHHLLLLTEELPNVMRGVEKKLLALDGRYAVAETAAPIRALYVLDRYDPVVAGRSDISVRPLSRRQALFVLLVHTSVRPYLLPSDDRCTLPLYGRLVQQASVRVLTYPNGFQHQDAVHARILEDLRTQ